MPYQKVEIRPYRSDDEPHLFGFARMTFGDREGWSDQRTLSVLEGDTVFVAEVEQAPAGYVALAERAGAVRVDQLFVAPEHEGEGIGHQLLEWAEGYAIWRGARSLEVVVEEDNRRAADFYRRSGFSEREPGLLERVLPQA